LLEPDCAWKVQTLWIASTPRQATTGGWLGGAARNQVSADSQVSEGVDPLKLKVEMRRSQCCARDAFELWMKAEDLVV